MPNKNTTNESMLSETQRFVLNYLYCMYRQNKCKAQWFSPTKIGQARSPKLHSAWASPRCLALRKLGLLRRSVWGYYKLSSRYIEELPLVYRRVLPGYVVTFDEKYNILVTLTMAAPVLAKRLLISGWTRD